MQTTNSIIGLLCLGITYFLTVIGRTQSAGASNPPSYSTDLETGLRASLYANYEVLQRPAATVTTQIQLNLLTVNFLNIKTQTLSTSGFFTMNWADSRLDWSANSNYTNVRFLFSNENYTWRPAIVIENSVSDISVFSDENTLMRINSAGGVSWSPGGIFQTNCEADVTYYPLDTQTCSITISTWAYTSGEVSLEFDSTEAIALTHFKENGEWEIKSLSNYSTSGTREQQSFSSLYFNIELRRRPLFHVLNTVFPVVLMASLTIFVFKLPPESGERIGMSLTVLLAYAVYLTLISDNIPQTSLSASILSIYLTIILMISALSVISTIIVLDIYFNHDDEEPVPEWAQTLTRKFFIPVTCWHGNLPKCCSGEPVSPARDGDEEKSLTKLRPNSSKPNSASTIASRKTKLQNNGNIVEQDDNYGRKVMYATEPHKAYKWKEIALVLDRFFLYVFVILVVTASVVTLSLLISEYNSY